MFYLVHTTINLTACWLQTDFLHCHVTFLLLPVQILYIKIPQKYEYIQWLPNGCFILQKLTPADAY